MARTIAELAAGVILYLDETVEGVKTHTPYINLGLDESGNARVLRQNAGPQRKMHTTNTAVYDGCGADVWLNDTESGFLSRFDAATLGALVETNIKCATFPTSTVSMVTLSRKCYLPSYGEVYTPVMDAIQDGTSILDALKTATGETEDAKARAADKGYWLRSGYSDARSYRNVLTTGYVTMTDAATNSTLPSMRPILALAANTPVSDEGAPAIFLLPEARETRWSIQTEMSLGSMDVSPTQCTLIWQNDDAISEYHYQICSNYGEEMPDWYDVKNGDTVTLREPNSDGGWTLGARVVAYADEAGGGIGEPILIMRQKGSTGGGGSSDGNDPAEDEPRLMLDATGQEIAAALHDIAQAMATGGGDGEPTVVPLDLAELYAVAADFANDQPAITAGTLDTAQGKIYGQ